MDIKREHAAKRISREEISDLGTKSAQKARGLHKGRLRSGDKAEPGAGRVLHAAGFKLIIGLGNPGSAYENTYHNVGLSFVMELIGERKAVLAYRGKNISLYKSGDLYLGVPACYMNMSGLAVKEALRKTQIPASELLIIHDDSDLPIGSLRMSFNRNSAGHKGIESIFAALGNREFWRARVGIRPRDLGKPARTKAADFVLKHIAPRQQTKLQSALKELETTTKLIENAAEPSG
jgi:PTH1 family peptidyl-tRNA hydrolase